LGAGGPPFVAGQIGALFTAARRLLSWGFQRV
jgi:hypothetical protein